MEIKSERFGILETEEKDLIYFKEGILGFPQIHYYLPVEIKNNPFFFWLQAADEPEIAFLVVDPFVFVKDYRVEIPDTVKRELEIKAEDEVLVYTIVTIPSQSLKDATTNLLGPLIINKRSRKAAQLVLANENYNIRYPLFAASVA